jgi:putative hydrolase of the HAD superfamily
MKKLKQIKYWLFDLDNTLYSGDSKVFDQVDKKMTFFISNKLNITLKEAKIIQKNYFHEYNTTLNGMIKNHKIDAQEFLEFVHDVDLEFLKKDTELQNELTRLNGKKFIFTNGSKAHAANVTKRIGIQDLFSGVFDIVDADFVPKPSVEPYKKIIEKYGIDPEYCIFIEDIARNLKPANDLGMKTAWVKNSEPWAAEFSNESFIDYKIDNLSEFLRSVNDQK